MKRLKSIQVWITWAESVHDGEKWIHYVSDTEDDAFRMCGNDHNIKYTVKPMPIYIDEDDKQYSLNDELIKFINRKNKKEANNDYSTNQRENGLYPF